jgi:hypothetical protein
MIVVMISVNGYLINETRTVLLWLIMELVMIINLFYSGASNMVLILT